MPLDQIPSNHEEETKPENLIEVDRSTPFSLDDLKRLLPDENFDDPFYQFQDAKITIEEDPRIISFTKVNLKDVLLDNHMAKAIPGLDAKFLEVMIKEGKIPESWDRKDFDSGYGLSFVSGQSKEARHVPYEIVFDGTIINARWGKYLLALKWQGDWNKEEKRQTSLVSGRDYETDDRDYERISRYSRFARACIKQDSQK